MRSKLPYLIRRNLNLGAPLFLIFACALLLNSGSASAKSLVKTMSATTLNRAPVKITVIPMPSNDYYTNLQFVEGSLWATHNSFWGSNAATLKTDPTTYEVTKIKRPYQQGNGDLLVAEQSIWFSNAPFSAIGSGIKRGGDLYRYNMDGSQRIATFEDAGSPIAFGDGAVWTFNRKLRKITGIDMDTNQIRSQWPVSGDRLKHGESFTYASGSIWTCTFEGEQNWTGNLLSLPQTFVKRLEPTTGKEIATIPLGAFHAVSRICSTAGAVWITGHRSLERPVPSIVRVDLEINSIAAEIPLNWGGFNRGSPPYLPQNIVHFNGYLYVLECYLVSIEQRYSLLKIDLNTNQVIDRLDFEAHGTFSNTWLTASEDALWMFTRNSLNRIVFQSL